MEGWKLERRPMTPREMIDRGRSLMKRVMRSWILMSITLVAAGASAYFVPRRVIKPIYRSEAAVLYQEGLQMSTFASERMLESRKHSAAMLEEVVRSHTSLEHVIQEVNPYPQVLATRGMVEAVQTLRLNIKIRVKNDTFVMSFDADNPDIAYGVMKHLVDRLGEENERLRGDKVSSTVQFLEREKKQAEQELEKREQALAAFLAQHPNFAQDTAAPVGGTTAAGASIRAAERDRIKPAPGVGDQTLQGLMQRAGAISRELRGGSPEPAAAAAAQDPETAAALAQANAEVAAAQRDLADKRSRFTDQHPDVVAATQKLQRAQARLQSVRPPPAPVQDSNPYALSAPEHRAELEAELASIQSQIAARRAGITPAPRASARAPVVANRIVALETEWVGLNRAVADARDRHAQLHEKLFAASMLASAESTGHAYRLMILDPPFRPTRPAARGPRLIAVLAFAAALMTGFAIALAKALLDRTLRDATDLKRLSFCAIGHVVPSRSAAETSS